MELTGHGEALRLLVLTVPQNFLKDACEELDQRVWKVDVVNDLVSLSSDSELDVSIYTETSGSCRSCAEAAVWDKFVDSKGNLFYLNPKPNHASVSEPRLKNGTDWKKTAGRRLKSFLKKKSSDAKNKYDACDDGRKDVWIRISRKSLKGKEGDEEALLGRLLGIVALPPVSAGENFVRVAAILPESSCLVSGKISPGDRLIAVNSEPVSYRDVQDILSACLRKKQKKIKLTLLTAASIRTENPLAPVFKSSTDVGIIVESTPSVTGSVVGNSENEVNSAARAQWISAWDAPLVPRLQSSAPFEGYVGFFSLRGGGDEPGCRDVNKVLYCYPSSVKSWKGKLGKMRGALLTLSQVAKDVISSSPTLSRLKLDENHILVSHVVQGPEVLILALECDEYYSRNLQEFRTHDLELFLDLEFGNLLGMQEALKSNAGKQELLNRLNAVFDSHFSSLREERNSELNGNLTFELMSSGLWDVLGSCRCPTIPLKLGLKMQLDSMLTDYESGAWEYSVDFESDWLRGCYISGSAVFFKGYLLASHLSEGVLAKVVLLLKFRKLFEVTWSRSVDQLVVWQPIFLDDDGFHSEDKRMSYLLVVGHGQLLYVVILESAVFTVGSVFLAFENVSIPKFILICRYSREAVAGPEYAYVQRGFKLLRQIGCLRFTEVAAASLLSGIISGGLNQIDSVLKSNGKTLVRKKSEAKQKTAVKNVGNKPRLVAAVSQPVLYPSLGRDSQRSGLMFRSQSQRDLTFDGDPTWESDGETSRLSFAPGRLREVDELDGIERPIRRGQSRNGVDDPAASSTPLPSTGSRSSSYVEETSVKGGVLMSLHPDDIEDSRAEFRVSRGPCNPDLVPSIFYFVAEMRESGVICCPVEGDILRQNSKSFGRLLNHFRSAVSIIRRRFDTDRKLKASSPMIEQGILMTLKNFGVGEKKTSSAKKSSCHFWVIGRYFPAPVEQELFVCHHESVPQDMTEIGFRLMSKF
ncbi:unnamed protein product [Notodromas monacha]|uniref:CCZ1/INTU second Longin domain-containing protein n=1 Tax=Notodromas monacha TaxID=399045 RepID=A0A7R9GC56_9CRUS|nr:unnamed protein product [Notodromas monacha]CAG0915491.1 unnamed protein product [Notodromas monacha]